MRPSACGRLRERRVRLAGVHVVQHRVAVRERAALGVLAGDAHADALDEQRRERQRLGVSPVDRAGVDRVAAARQRALHRRVQLERRRPGRAAARSARPSFSARTAVSTAAGGAGAACWRRVGVVRRRAPSSSPGRSAASWSASALSAPATSSSVITRSRTSRAPNTCARRRMLLDRSRTASAA